MSKTLAAAMCDANLAKGFAEVRRFISANVVTINDKPAEAWNQFVNIGDVVKCGKHKMIVT